MVLMGQWKEWTFINPERKTELCKHNYHMAVNRKLYKCKVVQVHNWKLYNCVRHLLWEASVSRRLGAQSVKNASSREASRFTHLVTRVARLS